MSSDPHTSAVAALADALIPAADGYPSGSQAGIPGAGLDAALAARPDLRPILDEAAAEVTAGRDAREVVSAWAAQQPESFASLFLLIRGAYFVAPGISDLFGYDGATARPLSDDTPADYLDLIGPVLARGPVYRSTP